MLVDGKPAEAAVVILHPVGAAEGVRPIGRTDKDGSFALTTFEARDGAPAGEYKVTVSWYRARTRPAAEGDDVPPQNLLPAVYADPNTTPLRATVRPGGNDPLTIDVKRR